MTRRSMLLLAGCFAILCPTAPAADWPQWRGPTRDDISQEKGLLQVWPAGGPKLLWTFPDAGVGYSAPAIVGDRLYCMGARKGEEYVYALDLQKGTQLWAAKVGPMFTWTSGNVWNAGPSSTPSVDGDFLYALGGQGNFVCVDTAKGAIKWQKNLPKDFGAQINPSAAPEEERNGWGFNWSPLVDGDNVIVPIGGKQGLLAALKKQTGEVVWQSKEVTDLATYSSPIAAEFNGVRHYIYVTNEGFYGINAKDGKLFWSWKRPKVYTDVLIPTPLYHDGYVYGTGGFNLGCFLVKLTTDGAGAKAEQVYGKKQTRVMQNREGGVILLGGYVYGHSERGWACQDFLKGDAAWADDTQLDRGSVTYADGRLYCYDEDGLVALVEPSPKAGGLDIKSKFEIPKRTTEITPRLSNGKTWTHPVIANGRLYLRDQDRLFCYDIKK